MKEISIARDFSRYPAGRYKTDGPNSGERFRDDILIPAFKAANVVRVQLDGTIGYGSSFLEESFGGLLRESDLTLSELEKRLQVVSNLDSSLELQIWNYIRDAAKKSGKR